MAATTTSSVPDVHVEVIGKKLRKYRKKLVKIEETKKRVSETGNIHDDQKVLLDSEHVTLEMVEELEKLKTEFSGLTVAPAAPVEPEVREIVKEVEVIVKERLDCDEYMEFMYLQSSGIMMDPCYHEWLAAVLSLPDLEKLREFSYNLAMPGKGSRAKNFLEQSKALFEKSETLIPDGDATYAEILQWASQVYNAVVRRETSAGEEYPRPTEIPVYPGNPQEEEEPEMPEAEIYEVESRWTMPESTKPVAGLPPPGTQTRETPVFEDGFQTKGEARKKPDAGKAGKSKPKGGAKGKDSKGKGKGKK